MNLRAASEDELVSVLVAFSRECVDPDRSDRYAELALNRRGREKWLLKLNHFHPELSTTKALPLKGNIQKLPRQATAILFSTAKPFRAGVVGPLVELVDAVLPLGCGAIIGAFDGVRPFIYIGEYADESLVFVSEK